MKVGVIGTGYVGLVTGVVLADLGNDVICVDIDEEKVRKLSSGEPTIYEPGLEELMRRAMERKFLRFSTSTAEATRASEVVFIAVGTPEGPDGRPNLKYVKEVAAEIARHIDKPTVVVTKSTVPVGTGNLVEQVIREQNVPDELFDVVSNPEFLREGSAIEDTLEPDRIVIGASNKAAADKLVELYSPLGVQPMVTNLNSAELIKYASNSFLAMKISFINAISQICERCEADVVDVARGMGLDKRIGGQFLQAGLGWGGSCFPKDVKGLLTTSLDMNYDFDLLREVIRVNDEQTERFIGRLGERLGGLEGKKIAMLGLAFKPNTDDVRDAKSLVLIDHIIEAGGSVVAYDPVADKNAKAERPDIEIVENPYDVSVDADALIVVTEWNEFKQMDLARLAAPMRSRVLFDGRRIYTRANAERAGFEYYTIGLKTS